MDPQGKNRYLDNSQIAAAEMRKSELLAEKENLDRSLATNYQIRAQLQKQLQSILIMQNQKRMKLTQFPERSSNSRSWWSVEKLGMPIIMLTKQGCWSFTFLYNDAQFQQLYDFYLLLWKKMEDPSLNILTVNVMMENQTFDASCGRWTLDKTSSTWTICK